MILQIMLSFRKRLQNCVKNEGHRLNDVIFKKGERHIHIII